LSELSPAARVIDLRSPAEFEVDHVPGAVNLPLFDDVERVIVGTLYARSSPDAAFERGRALAQERIEGLVQELADLVGWTAPEGDLRRRVKEMTEGGMGSLEEHLHSVPVKQLPERPVVLHCWRGGLRSRSVVAFLRGLGLDDALLLEGGYKAYREGVRARLETWRGPSAYALRGLTGVGKTLVLRELERQRPRWTFDLELEAGHRSSLLGMVGLEPVSQKAFESRLATRMEVGFPGLVVFEGESRKVGDAIIPERVWESLRGATSIQLVTTTEQRARVLIEDYLSSEANRAPLRAQLAIVEARMDNRAPLVEMFDAGRDEELVEVLLERYYDPLYRHSERGFSYDLTVDSTEPERAAAEIGEWIEARERVRSVAGAAAT